MILQSKQAQSAGEAFAELTAIVELLRNPGGCPWDAEQTHTSLRPNLLEETYETLEAIDSGDPKSLAEELGDIVTQIVFHADVARRQGNFDATSICNAVRQKLVRRHPHVFGSEKATTPQEAKESWNRMKRKEKKGSFLLDQVPKSSPALSFSQLLQERAANVGFDWDSTDPVIMKLNEELKELAHSKSIVDRTEELGDVLFTVVNLARKYDIHAENALRQSATKFVKRFEAMSELARLRNLNFEKLSMDEKDALWEEVKVRERDDSDKPKGDRSS